MKQKKNFKKAIFRCPFFKLLKSVIQNTSIITIVNSDSIIDKFSNVITYTPFPKKFFKSKNFLFLEIILTASVNLIIA